MTDKTASGRGAIAARLREERTRIGLKAGTVASIAGVSLSTYKRIEINAVLPADALAVLAGYGFDIDYILTGARLPPNIRDLVAAFRMLPGERMASTVQCLAALNVRDLMSRRDQDQTALLEYVFNWAPTLDAIGAFVRTARNIDWLATAGDAP
jgi:transcriptional regulator with XRE-family HTH domain